MHSSIFSTLTFDTKNHLWVIEKKRQPYPMTKATGQSGILKFCVWRTVTSGMPVIRAQSLEIHQTRLPRHHDFGLQPLSPLTGGAVPMHTLASEANRGASPRSPAAARRVSCRG